MTVGILSFLVVYEGLQRQDIRISSTNIRNYCVRCVRCNCCAFPVYTTLLRPFQINPDRPYCGSNEMRADIMGAVIHMSARLSNRFDPRFRRNMRCCCLVICLSIAIAGAAGAAEDTNVASRTSPLNRAGGGSRS